MQGILFGTFGVRWLPNPSKNTYFQALWGGANNGSEVIPFGTATVGSAGRWNRLALDANVGIAVIDSPDGEVTVPSVSFGVGRNILPK
jgi:hypothetical protein